MEYTYYGRNNRIKPKKGIIYSMFEEAMRQYLDKLLDDMRKEAEKIQKQNQAQIEKLMVETKSLNERFGWLLKVFEKDEVKEMVKKAKAERLKDVL